MWVGTGLLFRVAAGTALMALFARPSQASGSLGGFQPWVFVMVYASFAGQGAALTAFACYVRARWARLLGERTGQVVARRTAQARSGPEHHLAGLAEAVAGLAVAVAAVFCYWAAGGWFGLSGAQPHPVLGAAGGPGSGGCHRRGRAARPRRPWRGPRCGYCAALAWVGSGSLAAFDGLELLLNQLMSGAGTSGSGWSLPGTVLVIEVAVGVSCAAVGALAVTAARDDRPAGRQGLRRTGPVTGPAAGGARGGRDEQATKDRPDPGRELDPVGGRGLLGAHARHRGHQGPGRADSPFGVGRSAARGSGPAAEQAAHLVGRQCPRQDRRDLNAR